MNKKTLLLYAVIGGGIYYLFNQAKQAAAAHAAAVDAAVNAVHNTPLTQAPTDSLMPSTMQGALLGKIDDAHRQHDIHRKLHQLRHTSYLGALGKIRVKTMCRGKQELINGQCRPPCPKNRVRDYVSGRCVNPQVSPKVIASVGPVPVPVIRPKLPVPVTCPTGFIYQVNMGTCVSATCPPGYFSNPAMNGQCEPIPIPGIQPIGICMPGYMQNQAGQCVQEVGA